MRSKIRLSAVLRPFPAILLALVWFAAAGLQPALAAPANDMLPPSPACTVPGTGTVTCELWATTGTLSLPNSVSMPIWGYSASSGGPANLPGPILIAAEGDVVQVTLHNSLPVATSLSFPGQAIPPDLDGIAPGATKTYQFTADAPGTSLYEPGPMLKTAPYQLAYQSAMGLYGGLVIRPSGAAGQAYASPTTAFDDEALLILSEIDPNLNNRANPGGFDMRKFKPRYWLINGKAYPQTDPIPTLAGERILLRLANAGQQSHTLALLGLRQQTLALNGAELERYRYVASEELAPGASADMLAVVPSTAANGLRYALYEANLLLHNNGAAGFGGMLTFITLPASLPTGDIQGPAATALNLAPNPSDGSTNVTVTATMDDAARGSSNIQAAEFFIDAQGAPGSGTPMAAADLDGFNSPIEPVSALIPTATLAGLSGVNHSLYVRGQDAQGNWGEFAVVTLTVDNSGPVTSAITLTPPVSNGSVAVAIQATGNDTAAGGANIQAAEYFIDIDAQNPPANGSGTPMTVNVAAPTASLNASIPAGVMGALSEGVHGLFIHAQDARGNWGALANADLRVDKTGPAATSIAPIPAASDGAATVRINTTLTDPVAGGAQSNIAAAELFFDTPGAQGSGFPMTPSDGIYNAPSEAAYAFIPQSQINAMTSGAHTIYVRGRDASGNWGVLGTGVLVVDKDNPTTSGVSAAPNPTNGAVTIILTAAAADPSSAITAAEWFRNTDPGAGLGAPMNAVDGTFNSLSEALTAAINVTGWANGSHSLYVRARDSAGHWSPAVSTTLLVTPPASSTIFADGFESGNTSAWGLTTPTGGNLTINAASAMQGSFGMQTALAGNTPAYVTDLSPANENAYHARFYFNPRSTLSGTALVDILTGRTTGGTVIFRVQYRGVPAGGGTYQVRLQVVRAGGVTNSSFFTITNNSAHAIEVDWQSAVSGTIRFYVDGTLVQTLTGVNTSAYLLDSVRLGPSAGLTAGANGTPYFDAFISNNSGYIGP